MTTLRKLPMIAPSAAMNTQTIGNGTLMTVSIGGGIRANIVTRQENDEVCLVELFAEEANFDSVAGAAESA